MSSKGILSPCCPVKNRHKDHWKNSLLKYSFKWCLSPAVFRVTKSACGEVFIQYQHKQQQTQCSTCACVLISSHKHVLLS